MHKLVGAWKIVVLLLSVPVPYPQRTQRPVFVSSHCKSNIEYLIFG